jgi:hypothetical protein
MLLSTVKIQSTRFPPDDRISMLSTAAWASGIDLGRCRVLC